MYGNMTPEIANGMSVEAINVRLMHLEAVAGITPRATNESEAIQADIYQLNSALEAKEGAF